MTIRIVARFARTMGYVFGFLKPFYGFPKRGMVDSQIDSKLHTLDSLTGRGFIPSYQLGVTP